MLLLASFQKQPMLSTHACMSEFCLENLSAWKYIFCQVHFVLSLSLYLSLSFSSPMSFSSSLSLGCRTNTFYKVANKFWVKHIFCRFRFEIRFHKMPVEKRKVIFSFSSILKIDWLCLLYQCWSNIHTSEILETVFLLITFSHCLNHLWKHMSSVFFQQTCPLVIWFLKCSWVTHACCWDYCQISSNRREIIHWDICKQGKASLGNRILPAAMWRDINWSSPTCQNVQLSLSTYN